MFRPFPFALLLLSVPAAVLAAGVPDVGKPLLQLDADNNGGPTTVTTAMQFSPDGNTLYAAGLDKVVRVWKYDKEKMAWAQKPSIRVPIGLGLGGSIYALAVSPDGRWLAVAGRFPSQGESQLLQRPRELGAAALQQLEDLGAIYVFELDKDGLEKKGNCKELRGHKGVVQALTFVQGAKGNALLVSAGIDGVRKDSLGAVRLWDAQAGDAPLAVLSKEKPEKCELANPDHLDGIGLAAWCTGDGTNKEQVRVAIAWPERSFDTDDRAGGHIRLWDVSRKKVTTEDCGSGNHTACLLGLTDSGARVAIGNFRKIRVTGELVDWQGHLAVWQISSKPEPTLREEEKKFPVDTTSRGLPFALAAISSQGDEKKLDKLVTVTTLYKNPKEEFILAVEDIATGKRNASVRLTKIQQDKYCPVMAASPRGQWIAVACFQDHAIEIYALKNLLGDKETAPQRLQSTGTHFSKAQFVRRGEEVGLWLSEESKGKPLEGGKFFSFHERTLTGDQKGWRSDAPVFSADDMKQSVKDGKRVVDLTVNGKQLHSFILDPDDQITSVTCRPATEKRKQGLVAVAHTNSRAGETYITLFDTLTGKKLRQFTGHVQQVTKLSFSDTLPLLVSVGEDQTVRVWSFADLNDGGARLEGVVVEDRMGEDKKNQVVVKSVAEKSPADKAGLKVGDVIERAGDDKRVVTSAVMFDWLVSLKKPDQNIAVQVKNKEILTIGVERAAGIELRRPLLSLAVSGKEWIAWSPAGPFDRSSEKIDTYIGWHVNTGEPAKPVSFMKAGEYHEMFYKGDKGLLKHLIEYASLPKALDAIAAASRPAPTLQAHIEGDHVERLKEWFFVRSPANLELSVNLVEEDYPVDKQDTLTWSRRRVNPPANMIDEGKIELGGGRENLWHDDLAKLPWSTGEYVIEVKFHSPKSSSDPSPETLKVRYQPPAPKLSAVVNGTKLKAGEDRAPVDVTQKQIDAEITVIPQAKQQVQVQFRGAKTAKTDAFKEPIIEGVTVPLKLDLKEGDNDIEITAANKDPLKDHEDDETSVLRVKIRYQVPNEEKPPTITALGVTSPKLNTFKTKDSKGDVLVVDQPTIKISSTIKAEKPNRLAHVEWTVGTRVKWAAGDKEALKIDELKRNLFEFSQEVTLPDNKVPTELRLSAATGNGRDSETTDVRLRVVYSPPPPEISMALPDPREETSTTATVRGLIKLPAVKGAYVFKVLVKNKDGETEIDPKVDQGKWSAPVQLARGENTVQALLRSPWRRDVVLELPKPLVYRQPPTISDKAVSAAIKKVNGTAKPFVSFSVKVLSPSDAKIVGATLDNEPWQAVYDDEPVQTNRFKVEKGKALPKGDLTEWKLTFDDVPAKTGADWRKELKVKVENADGLSPDTVTIRIDKTSEDFPPPLVKWDAKKEEFTQRLQYVTEPIQIDSESPLTRVEVLCKGQTVYTAKLKPGQCKWGEKAIIPLEWGANQLQVFARNEDGGESRSDVVVVTATKAAGVRLVIDHLEIKDAKGQTSQELKPKKSSTDKVQFEELSQGVVYVHGHVEWDEANDDQLGGEKLQLIAFVNGARQLPVPLDAQKEKRRREFTALIGLPRAKDNVIEIELPSEVKAEGTGSKKFFLDCSKPIEDQRLHVLIIGVGVKDADREKLKVQVLSILGSEPPDGFKGPFKAEAFKPAFLYAVLGERVDKRYVAGELLQIRRKIEQLQETDRSKGRWQNDVVLVYFQGSDAVGANGKRYLRMALNEENPGWSAAQSEAVGFPYEQFGKLAPAGAQLVVVNVPPAPKGTEGSGGNNRYGVIRFANPDREDAKKPESAVLTGLKTAADKLKKGSGHGTLGELLEQTSKELKANKIDFSDHNLENLKDLPLIKRG